MTTTSISLSPFTPTTPGRSPPRSTLTRPPPLCIWPRGLVKDAAKLLKTSPTRLKRVIANHPHLQRIAREHLEVLNDRSIAEVAHAFDSPDDRRREWATSKVLAEPPRPRQSARPAAAGSKRFSFRIESGAGKRYTFRWRTDADDVPPDEGPVIDHDDGPSAA